MIGAQRPASPPSVEFLEAAVTTLRIALTLGQAIAAAAAIRTIRTATMVRVPHFIKVELNDKAVNLEISQKYFYRYKIK